MIYNIPNLLTLLRIFLIPVLVVFVYLPVAWAHIAATAVFALAAFTDLLDGYLARRLGQVSALGAFLDPVADKLMVATALVLLVEADPTPVMAIPAVVIVGREITISGLREWMAGIGARTQVAVSTIGKFKTTAQMIAISLLLFREPVYSIPVYTIGLVLLYVAVVLTLWSMTLYLRAAWPRLTDGESGSGSAFDDE